ncbi:MAG TPA: PAS domain S-box protein [Tepidisphaeraceae bacterium]|jgi:PAS domain S-box-containing protein|nr:PAS domain S-box protein [Tepidisphaeraceae bacterium]
MTERSNEQLPSASTAPGGGHDQNDRIRAIAQNAIDLVTLVDAAGNYTYINEAWERSLGYGPEELLGRNCLELVHPDDRPRVRESVARVMSTPDATESVVFRFKARNGEWRVFEARGRNKLHDPLVAGLLVNSRDITDQKRIEEHLRSSEERSRLILETAQDAFIGMNAQGYIIEWNRVAEEIFGWIRAQVIGLGVAEVIIPPEYRSGHVMGLKRFLATGIGPVLGRRLELFALHKSGRRFPVELMVSQPIRSGGDLFFAAFLRDITARKEAERELIEARAAAEAAAKTKSEFLAHMSHELRTPLNGVLGYVQILQRDPMIIPRQRESLDAIEGCGEQLLSLINDVLDLSKIEAGRLEVHNEPFALDRLIKSVANVTRPRAQEKGLAFEISVAPDLPEVLLSDERKLRQVLVNLLGNSVKFTAFGSVHLEVSQNPQGRIRFDVKDTGIGIDPQTATQIFDAFRQSKAGLQEGGTGLGLSISKRLVQSLGGTLDFESEVDHGAHFFFSVPLVEPEIDYELPRGDDTSGEHQFHLPPDAKLTAVVADDRATNRDVLVRMLQAAGIQTLEAHDGRAALELIRIHRPPLVLMDVRMPVMSGLDATRMIREDPSLKETVVIAVTASVFPDFQQKIREAGCNEILGKPLRAAEVFGAIERHLAIKFVATPVHELPAQNVSAPRLSLAPHLAAAIAQRIRDASEIGDVAALGEIVTELQGDEVSSPLASDLSRLIKSFNFDAIKDVADALESK